MLWWNINMNLYLNLMQLNLFILWDFFYAAEIFISSQKVVRCSLTDVWFSLSRCGVKLQAKRFKADKNLQCVFHEFIDFHDCGLVTTSITVVRGWEHSHDISFMGPVVSVHNKLMGSWDKFKVVGMIELFRDILTKRVSSTSWWDTPTASIIWIWP